MPTADGRRSTIFATSSGRPPAAIAVIRISGPDAFEMAAQIAGSLPEPRRAALRPLRDEAGDLLDRALVLIFPGPDSATGEDVVELHCHGGRAVIRAVEARLRRAPALRHAEPGEFTRRGLLNGRLDLAQAESLADLLEAETEDQRRAALAGTEGLVSAALVRWMEELTSLAAEVEVTIDYSDEEDGSGDAALQHVSRRMATIAAEMAQTLTGPSVEQLGDPITVVIAGPPNTGKSTLFNRLADRDLAIVSARAGTTRDRLEATVVRDGIIYLLVDTAGLNDDTSDPIEAEGIRRAHRAAQASEILLWTGDDPPVRQDAVWLHMRADLPDRSVTPPGRTFAIGADRPVPGPLWDGMATKAREVSRSDPLILRERQRSVVADVAEALLVSTTDLIIVAETLRLCRGRLAELLGIDAPEQLLDRLFSRFCLGK